MNGPHDMGGQQGFGPVVAEANEPAFHHEWERRAFGLVLAMAGTRQWNLDQSRHARETIGPAKYLSSSYYKIWFEGMSRLMLERSLVTRDELSDGRKRAATATLAALTADRVKAALAQGASSSRPAPAPARFRAGDRVRTKNIHPQGHTRLPRYCRGKPGTIAGVHGAHVFPDSNAMGLGENPQWLYTVRFEARELWGEDTTASAVYADLWEPYLE